MKHPASIEYASTIAKQLSQLGAKEQEIIKAYPKPEDVRRMKKRQQVPQDLTFKNHIFDLTYYY